MPAPIQIRTLMEDIFANVSTTIGDAAAGIGPDAIDEFTWLVVLGGFVCFAMAWGIGANDVANAFSTSVGARAINLKQATVIAGIFEFVGAIGLGATVTNTVRKGIVNFEEFEGEEDVLMLGMFCALCSAAIWLALATKYSLPVSTTQSVVGAIAGFAICAKGSSAINWVGETEDGKLVKYNGITFIAIFWIASPFFAAIGSVLIFLPIRNFLLRRKDSYQMTLKTWPFFVFLVVFVMVLFLMIKGLKRLDYDYEEALGLSFGITFGVAIGVAIIAYFIFIYSGIVDRFVMKSVNQSPSNQDENDVEMAENTSPETPNDGDKDKDTEVVEYIASELKKKEEEEDENDTNTKKDDERAQQLDVKANDDGKRQSRAQLLLSRGIESATAGVNVDIHDDLGQLEHDIQSNAEKFDPKTDRAFAWLQVCTASLDIFAHGSNDVANAVAPFAAMVGLLETGTVTKEVAVYEWILVIGAFGMVIGLATYGYKIMKCLGVRMAPMTCTRGYAIELSSALVVIIASAYGFPTSTTHAQVGATVGVGLVELNRPDSKLTIGQVVNW
eukprot:CAMPEP_0201578162 /NCGR_PEP_ID=MMETSP0190_2-20130828/24918_1 /ASSEMBLY_ACC=CAM_ASM_000263 /TAXON_ID=37353 /ORGANISM="Rosalina sp." /LENGTH=556 /DNA_ID=CAMNT_0048011043 /DNA_START=187 /DNA_END=1854 /DNA_ORIENTATION=-